MEVDSSFLPLLGAHYGDEKEGAKPPLHALSGIMNSIVGALPGAAGTDDLLLLVLLVILFNSNREDRLGLMVAVGYLLLFGHEGSTA